jgi:hypothetical protein
MKTPKFSTHNLFLILVSCFTLFSCEKEDIAGTGENPNPQCLYNDGPHTNVLFTPCAGPVEGMLFDPYFNAWPVANANGPAGSTYVDHSVDSLRVRVTTNPGYHLSRVRVRVAIDVNQLAAAVWDSIVFSPTHTASDFRFLRPNGNSAAVQVEANVQRIGQAGTVVYNGMMSPFNQLTITGMRWMKVNYSDCCPQQSVSASISK